MSFFVYIFTTYTDLDTGLGLGDWMHRIRGVIAEYVFRLYFGYRCANKQKVRHTIFGFVPVLTSLLLTLVLVHIKYLYLWRKSQ